MMYSVEQYLDLIAQGRVLGMFDQHWNFNVSENDLSFQGKYDLTYISLPITLPEVQDGYLDAPADALTGSNGLGITVDCEDPVRLLKFFDWLIQEEVQTYLYWGEEGKDYFVDEQGRFHLTESRRKLLLDAEQVRDLTGHVLACYSPKMQGLYEPGGNACEPAYQPEEYKASLSQYDQTFLDAYGFWCDADFLSPPVHRPAYYPVWSMLFDENSAAQSAHDAVITLCRRYYPRLILCPAEDFDQIWTEFTDKVNQVNVQPYLDGIRQQICQRMGCTSLSEAPSFISPEE